MLSAPIVTTAPTDEPVDIDEVKLFLRVDGEALDAEIAGYVGAVVADIERMTSTRLASQVVEIRADSFADLARFNIGPVTDVVAITYEDGDGAQQTLSEDAYELFGSGLAMGIRPASGQSWPAVRPVAGAIAARLTVGYADLPPSLALAVKMAVRSRFDGTPFDLFEATVNDRIWL
ncbi:putative phiE125 gp8 family phage protein [Sphingobium wenxiniae]|uniref:Putative phiE125 gp8 family phage protein n=1 Tax=Sphingobium wenxiniae (strain DSM 21828 / CGMCC 1.7748 / JZ-1) TaxID=595605 RepID=A0A562KKQ4_SPHWJ|nr:hypothetical protein [Sphingobium wenxiniae]MBB6191193.1 putative phiE125 gp8 family phage protein [Sphingobium wenxiniae]TWH96008.1 putative phiE125 gp8 family phage protein [Sphingobium wenxiniae]